MEIGISNNTAQEGDSFLLKPVDNVISGMNTLINNAADFASADSTGGASNNENIKELIKLQDQKLVGGTSTFSDFMPLWSMMWAVKPKMRRLIQKHRIN